MSQELRTLLAVTAVASVLAALLIGAGILMQYLDHKYRMEERARAWQR